MVVTDVIVFVCAGIFMLHELGFEYAKELSTGGGLSPLESWRKVDIDEVSPADAGRGGLFTDGEELIAQ